MTTTQLKCGYDLDDIKQAMRGRAVEVLANVAGIPSEVLDGRHHGCPRCGEGKDRFRLLDANRGAVLCNQCLRENNGDAISAVMHFKGVSFPEALELIGKYLGVGPTLRNRRSRGKANRATRPTRPTPPLAESIGAPNTVASSSNADATIEASGRHEVYSVVLSGLGLSDKHREALRQRGLSDAAIEAVGYRSVVQSAKSSRILRAWVDESPVPRRDLALTVPGVIQDEEKQMRFASPPGVLIPVRDETGQIQALRIRVDNPGEGGKYRWISSRSRKRLDLPSPGTPCHVPIGITGPVDDLRITEGELKADIAFQLSGVPTISIAGVGTWETVLPLIERLQPKRLRIALDADYRTNVAVATALQGLMTMCCSYEVAVETWPLDAGKGIDDVLASGHVSTLVQGADLQSLLADLPVSASNCKYPAGRAEIIVTTEEHRVNDAAITAIAGDEKLFVRAGMLVRIVDADTVQDGIFRQDGTERISAVAPQSLRELMTRRIEFVEERMNPQGDILVKPVHPPWWCVSAVHARGTWSGIRPLRSIVACPVLRPDGSIISTNGYDPITGLYLSTAIELPPIPARPNRDDAIRACDVLLEVIDEFPFATPEHRAAWLTFALTMLARYAFCGPSPLFLIDANTRGSGKSLLADLVGVIATGTTMSRMSNPKDDDECRKRITALALAGDPLVLIDNVCGNLGCASLDAALTAPDSWKDRILGKSEIVDLPLSIIWSATGNNIMLEADTSRRAMHIRLDSDLENPELRSGFKHPNLISYVKKQRAALVAAGLTILSGYHAAGRPSMNLPAWGSFDAWSDLIRGAVVWCGQPDPGQTRGELAARSDVMAGVLQVLINQWQTIDPEYAGLTSAELLRKLDVNQLEHDAIRGAVCELCETSGDKLPTTRSLGNRFKHVSGRVINGKTLTSIPEHGTARWVVRPVKRTAIGCSGGSGCSVTLPNDVIFDEPASLNVCERGAVA